MHPDPITVANIPDLRRRELLAEAERDRFAGRLRGATGAPARRAAGLPATVGRTLVRAGERLQGLPATGALAAIPSGK